MKEELTLRRIDNPEGHQVCQVDEATRTVAIQNKNYLTVIHFQESGKYHVEHQKVEKPMKKAACN